jgi:hypothetical protein
VLAVAAKNVLNAILTETLCAQTSSQGIQTLLEAEKEAAKVVQKARQCRSLKILGPALVSSLAILTLAHPKPVSNFGQFYGLSLSRL